MLDIEGLRLRAAFLCAVRNFFAQQDFLEVDTPVRLPVIIPETHITPVIADGLYLQASPELCMKMILAQGAERIFQICPCFRKEEKGRLHAEEFTLLEWYRKDADYFQLMDDCRALVCSVVAAMKKYEAAPFAGIVIDGAWQRITVADAFTQYSPVSLEEALAKDMFDELLVEHIEPYLGTKIPTFLYNYPVSLGSLARISATDCRIVERFELYIGGVEIANGFSELADENEQRQRFIAEIETIEQMYHRKTVMPEKFLERLSAMGEAAGIALGLERLLMLLTNRKRLSDIQSFDIYKDFS